eukprot:3543947-Amphidinium_carterae.1
MEDNSDDLSFAQRSQMPCFAVFWGAQGAQMPLFCSVLGICNVALFSSIQWSRFCSTRASRRAIIWTVTALSQFSFQNDLSAQR